MNALRRAPQLVRFLRLIDHFHRSPHSQLAAADDADTNTAVVAQGTAYRQFDLKEGVDPKAVEFVKQGAEIYRKA